MKLLRGLTLIEILVVVAILGVLMALLTPVFNRAKVSAKKVDATQNLRILGLGQLQYSEEYNGLVATSNNKIGQRSWYATLRPYCKIDPLTIVPPLASYKPGPYDATGYAVNECNIAEIWKGSFLSRTVLVFETTAGISSAGPPRILFTLPSNQTHDGNLEHQGEIVLRKMKILEPRQSSIYFGQGAYAFLDGHVKFYPPNAFLYRPINYLIPVSEICKMYPEELNSNRPTFNTHGDTQ